MRAWLWLSLLLGTLACDLNPQPTLPGEASGDFDPVAAGPSPMMPSAEEPGPVSTQNPSDAPGASAGTGGTGNGTGGTGSGALAPTPGDSGSGGTPEPTNGGAGRQLTGDAGDSGAAGL